MADPYEQNIGELDKWITLQQPSRVADGMGGFTETWADVTTVAAKAWTVSSAEGSEAQQAAAMTRIQKFQIRYRSVLRPSWRVKFGTRYFALGSIDPDQRNVFLFLTCKELVA